MSELDISRHTIFDWENFFREEMCDELIVHKIQIGSVGVLNWKLMRVNLESENTTEVTQLKDNGYLEVFSEEPINVFLFQWKKRQN
jgi:hypothetical protein